MVDAIRRFGHSALKCALFFKKESLNALKIMGDLKRQMYSANVMKRTIEVLRVFVRMSFLDIVFSKIIQALKVFA